MKPEAPIETPKRDWKSIRSLKIQTMEEIYDASGGNSDHPHRHEYYTVVWVQEGKGSHLIDFNEYEFAGNQVYFVSPGQIHKIITKSRPRGWVITFHSDFLIESGLNKDFLVKVNLFRQYSDSPPIELEDDATVSKIMETLQHYYFLDEDYRNEALGAALTLFLIECVRQCDTENTIIDESPSCVLIDFKNAVEDNYADLHKVSEYADLLHITPKHLNEVIKTTIGTNAKDYIIDRILTESKRLLLHTEGSVKQIAIQLGFKEPLHFNTFFKKRTGLTPLQYKNGNK